MNKNKNTVYVKLPSDVQAARHGCKGAFNLWKQQNFSDNGEVHDVYRLNAENTENTCANSLIKLK